MHMISIIIIIITNWASSFAHWLVRLTTPGSLVAFPSAQVSWVAEAWDREPFLDTFQAPGPSWTDVGRRHREVMSV